ncbi:ParB/RepB/Spo0J family partition protein [Streptosporangium sp. NPDC000396]|uniref:ParB/RepB/Spo0J family partition protein n=1 Tax=Streptosporangium sp. NPDC000396 TaxID=3366185 RepID=UPI0036802A6C
MVSNHALSPETELVPLSALRPADSPRLAGEDAAHVLMLAEIDVPLPAIVVHRATMRIIDGMHRFHAAHLRGDDEIEVRFFDGGARDAFILAVRLNAAHGLPLTQADRAAAAARIIDSHPQWSDRLIASASGLSHRTIAGIRRNSTGSSARSNARTGRDGRVRPLNAAEGRMLAFRVMTERPEASLREIAEVAGIAVSTARDVRERVRLGQDPVPRKLRGDTGGEIGPADGGGESRVPSDEIGAVLDRLKRDPSLRFTDVGRTLLRLLDATQVVSTDGWMRVVGGIPPHCTETLAQVARACAESWLYFAREIETRGRESA